MAELGDDKDSQTEMNVEVLSGPAGLIRLFRLIRARSCEESAGKTAESPSCRHTSALPITALGNSGLPYPHKHTRNGSP